VFVVTVAGGIVVKGVLAFDSVVVVLFIVVVVMVTVFVATIVDAIAINRVVVFWPYCGRCYSHCRCFGHCCCVRCC